MRHLLISIALITASASGAAAAPNAELAKIRIDLDEQAQPLRDVLKRLQTKHELNYAVSEEVLKGAGLVTVKLKRVPLDAALEAICSACGLSLEFRGPILVILPKARRALPAVREGLLPKGNTFLPARRTGSPTRARPSPKQPRRPLSSPPASSEQMAVGPVLKVDLKKGLLQLKSAGVKRDFFLPTGADPQRRSARLGVALSQLKVGNRVALLYTHTDGRAVITQLIGGAKPRQAEAHRRRRGPRGRKRPAVRPLSRNPKTAPEPGDLPPSVLVGTFLERKGEVVRIRRADGKVLECHLPPAKDTRRKRVVEALKGLRPNARVFMMYEHKEGKYWITDSGITERPKTEPKKK